MIQLENLTRRYGDAIAVNNLTCRIQSGEIIGLLGRNGAGKTTTMKMITGALEPDTGRVVIDGDDLAEHRRALQRRIGYLPENCPVYPEMTVVEYLHYRASLLDVPKQERMPAIRRVLAQAELGDKLLAPIATLSRGYRQRVGVAQAILHRPDIVILDEPTNGLDPQQIGHMRVLIQELAHQATVIVSTHILQEVEAVCQRVLVLRHGELVLDTPLDTLRRDCHLEVETDADEAAFQALAGDLQGVVGIRTEGGGRYRLALAGESRALGAELARRLLGQGHALYRLQPSRRDLETLFREVNEGDRREVAHG